MSSSIGIQQHMNRCKEHSAHNLFHSATKKNDQYRHSLILQVVQEQSTALPFYLFMSSFQITHAEVLSVLSPH